MRTVGGRLVHLLAVVRRVEAGECQSTVPPEYDAEASLDGVLHLAQRGVVDGVERVGVGVRPEFLLDLLDACLDLCDRSLGGLLDALLLLDVALERGEGEKELLARRHRSWRVVGWCGWLKWLVLVGPRSGPRPGPGQHQVVSAVSTDH